MSVGDGVKSFCIYKTQQQYNSLQLKMERSKIVRSFLVTLLLVVPIICNGARMMKDVDSKDWTQVWGYSEVRPKAHMFSWYYKSPFRTQEPNKPWPIVLWLQGGPGASGVGYGNFAEIGPLDNYLLPRHSTWLRQADLLFVDNPVGTGYSYVEDPALLVKTDDEAATDLTTLLIEVFSSFQELQNCSLFLVAESYGGKYAVTTALSALKAIQDGKLKINLGGVALGDSWISPEDFVLSWGPLLKEVSRLDNNGLLQSNSVAEQIREDIKDGKFIDAVNDWSLLEDIISTSSNSVDFYNFMLDTGADPVSLTSSELSQQIAFSRYSRYLNSLTKSTPVGNGDLDTLMNGPIRKKLTIIPDNVTWIIQSYPVFEALQGDFMRPRIHEVDLLLAQGINVNVYNGQLDVICATKGTEAWVEKLKWHGLKTFLNKERTPLYCGDEEMTKGFVKSYKNFHSTGFLVQATLYLLTSLYSTKHDRQHNSVTCSCIKSAKRPEHDEEIDYIK